MFIHSKNLRGICVSLKSTAYCNMIRRDCICFFEEILGKWGGKVTDCETILSEFRQNVQQSGHIFVLGGRWRCLHVTAKFDILGISKKVYKAHFQ